MRTFKTVLVTGGAGFIGSNFIRYLLSLDSFNGKIVNIDSLSYAGNLESLSDISKTHKNNRYFFEHIDIRNKEALTHIFEKYNPDCIVHFAAESHVDRSILGPADFISTNIIGTFNLLEVARSHWKDTSDKLFHHVSTDEVYGSLGDKGLFREDTSYDPRSPYSASKASSDHLVRAYFHTYNFPITLSNCSNNYGPYQFPEKLIPLMILNMLEKKSLPVYGDGKYIRDWLYVEDHNNAVWTIMQKGLVGESYNIGGENEWENIKLLHRLIEIVSSQTNTDKEEYLKLISYVKDRPGHDRRYAIDCSKIKKELGWKQNHSFDEGLENTVSWYLANIHWCQNIKTGEYKNWLEKNYNNR